MTIICRLIPMQWLAGVYVRRNDWRSGLALHVYIWIETRRVHAALQREYQEETR